MEHKKTSTKPINKILKFLPRATSSVSFQNPQLYSPAKDKKPSEKPRKSNLGIGFSGPRLSIVPSKNHQKIKNDTFTYEPTSPIVSCMGQVKCKHYRKLANKPANKFSRTTSFPPAKTYNNDDDQEKVTKSKKKSGIRSLFRGGPKKSNDNKFNSGVNLSKGAPISLGNMKRFSSGRDVLSNFDWTIQVTPLDCDQRNYVNDDGEEIIIPSSAPVMERNKGFCENFVRGGGVSLEPRKEINLWKRRTMAQPMPLQLHVDATN